MIQTYKIILPIFFFVNLLVAVPCGVAQDALLDFLSSHNSNYESVDIILQSKVSHGCFDTTTHAICVNAQKFKSKKSTDSKISQGIFKALEAHAKLALYNKITNSVDTYPFKNRDVAISTYTKEAARGNINYILTGIEWTTGIRNDFVIAIAAVQNTYSIKIVKEKSKQRFFAIDYCQTLFPKAVKLYNAKDYNGALIILKEAHDLKWAKANAYIMAANAFLKTDQSFEAKKIAIEVLIHLKDQLTSILAEELGEIFLDLEMEKEAKIAYDLAISQFDNIN